MNVAGFMHVKYGVMALSDSDGSDRMIHQAV